MEGSFKSRHKEPFGGKKNRFQTETSAKVKIIFLSFNWKLCYLVDRLSFSQIMRKVSLRTVRADCRQFKNKYDTSRNFNSILRYSATAVELVGNTFLKWNGKYNCEIVFAECLNNTRTSIKTGNIPPWRKSYFWTQNTSNIGRDDKSLFCSMLSYSRMFFIHGGFSTFLRTCLSVTQLAWREIKVVYSR